jgi:hypothetical protein
MEHKPKRNRNKNLSVQEYVNALEEVRHQINVNPKVKTSRFADEFGFSKIVISDLKKMGVIREVKNKGVFWLSNEEIDTTFVLKLKKFMKVQNKVKTGGKKITGCIRGQKEPSKIARQQKFTFNSDVSTQPVESVKEWENRIKKQRPDVTAIPISTEIKPDVSFEMSNWNGEKAKVEVFSPEKAKELMKLKDQIQSQEKEVVVTTLPDSTMVSEFINHHEEPKEPKQSNQKETESQTIEVKIFGFTLFTFKKSRK